jgi:hypothetical protein
MHGGTTSNLAGAGTTQTTAGIAAGGNQTGRIALAMAICFFLAAFALHQVFVKFADSPDKT